MFQGHQGFLQVDRLPMSWVVLFFIYTVVILVWDFGLIGARTQERSYMYNVGPIHM